MSGRGARARAILWTLALGLSACHANAPPTAPDERRERSGGGAGGGAEKAKAESVPSEPVAPEELEGLEAQLGQAWGQLQVLEDGSEPVATSPSREPRPAPDRCERIRGLADRICMLSDTMCALADEHRGQERYASSCARAQQTCARALLAADRCVGA